MTLNTKTKKIYNRRVEFYMEKLLPFNFNWGNNTDCWNSKFLGIVLSNDAFLPWYVERFSSIFLRKRKNEFLTHYYDRGSSAFNYLYQEVLDFKRIKERADIIRTIKNAIDNNSYVLLAVQVND
jgi:hypothetical protein